MCKCFTITIDTHGVRERHHLSHKGLFTTRQAKYFCPVHECHRVIWITRPVVQPFCGDCAAVIFHGHSSAFWIHSQDLKASAIELPLMADESVGSPINANRDTLDQVVDMPNSDSSGQAQPRIATFYPYYISWLVN
ncbi:hypothetical protein AU210_009084 [Fusarium oxysporum f. sp. radicis-cucumerinum]|uniref:Uncharacterized protein n=2 Tax=Fusarium oxysporum TaxID=5507 RepID=A0A2H3GQ32_FUSOX|nr:hypothetical protein AU210_009084 [Fusarium oxysporum f. sp. radicis-cucumerinum]RKK16710.1 hypothetical protein BFJ65_g10267 [Fusarium oxysporum f. sp. cepae]RKK61474.1 hypothetical protein BFJ67_g1753 [Fusarium oxysporum f. sp. cepae]RKK62939.1 hypothetical protein BFJ66_g724 [Fusarium oxysporum f. sp. cepae]